LLTHGSRHDRGIGHRLQQRLLLQVGTDALLERRLSQALRTQQRLVALVTELSALLKGLLAGDRLAYSICGNQQVLVLRLERERALRQQVIWATTSSPPTIRLYE